MIATNLNKFRLARRLLYTMFYEDTYSLPVHIPQMSIYVAGQEVFLADRALCPLSSCRQLEEDRDSAGCPLYLCPLASVQTLTRQGIMS